MAQENIPQSATGSTALSSDTSNILISITLARLSLVIIIWGLLVFGNTLLNDFVYDDHDVIEENVLITSLHNLPLLFTRDYFAHTIELSYRPLVTFTYFIDYALFDLMPPFYHLFNVLIHICNALLVMLLLTRMLTMFRISAAPFSPLLAFAGALFFLLHPIVTEPVNLISYREDLLCSGFVIASFLLYLYTRDQKTVFNVYLPASLLCFFLAMMSKEQALALPLFILLFEALYSCRQRISSISLRGTLPLILFFCIALIYAYLRFVLFVHPHHHIVPVWGGSRLWSLLNFPYVFIFYLRLIIFPIPLSADYNMAAVTTFLNPRLVVSILLIIIYILLIIAFIKKNCFMPALGLSWFLIFLIPASNVIPLSNPVAERYLYLPLIGFAFFISWLVGIIVLEPVSLKPAGIVLRRVFIIMLILFILYSWRDIRRNEIWRNDLVLWLDTLEHQPRSLAALRGLGLIYLNECDFVKAEIMLRKAVEIYPNDIKVRNNLAVLYARKGNLEQAIQQLKSIVSFAPGYAPAYYNLARCYTAVKPADFGKAMLYAQKALDLGYSVPPDFMKTLKQNLRTK